MDESSVPRPGTGIMQQHAGLTPVAEYMRMSTDHQKYSIEFQSGAIRRFAVQNQMSVVRTYLDDGKSGLTLKGRPGLQALLRDVIAVQRDFAAILVYDVSRWGRFQDADEPAFYEFMCKQAGVRVIYCSESFDDSPMGGLVKNIKRVMAGEFSRNLSVRVWGGQVQAVQAGFKQGGAPGYGLRRYLLSHDGKAKGPLGYHEWKALTSDKVILIPGPPDEVENVWWIYDAYILYGKSSLQIAAELNARFPDAAYKWTRARVWRVLSHPKYAGVNIYNRTSQKLKSKVTRNPESRWVQTERAFRGLVTPKYFQRAAEIRGRVRGRRADRVNRTILASRLRALLRLNGYLSCDLIRNTPGMGGMATYVNHFGSMRAAMEAAGYCTLSRRSAITWARQLRDREALFVQEMRGILQSRSIRVLWDAKNKLLWVGVDRMIAVAVVILRGYRYFEKVLWHAHRIHQLRFDECLVVRMNEWYSAPHDYHAFPVAALRTLPKLWGLRTLSLAPYRVDSLPLLVERWKSETSTSDGE